MMEAEVLICDDDTDLREMVAEYLEARGFAIRQAAETRALDAALAEALPDLVILDIRMPGEDGLTALRRIRIDCDVPVLMLTAADGVIDRVLGLEMGADDYVGKPVDLRELEARVKALLRRRGALPAGAGAGASVGAGAGIVRFGPFAFDVEGARLTGAQGDVALTAMEFALLKVFVERRGRVLTRDQLLELAHHRGWEPFDRSIDLRISRLRRKIEPEPSKPRYIKTVRGLGYLFASD
jgi:two-component system phosphate regulon response regulator OmpR